MEQQFFPCPCAALLGGGRAQPRRFSLTSWRMSRSGGGEVTGKPALSLIPITSAHMAPGSPWKLEKIRVIGKDCSKKIWDGKGGEKENGKVG